MCPEVTASFRDPNGFVFAKDGRIFRVMSRKGREELDAFLSTKTAQKMLQNKTLVATAFLSESDILALGIDGFVKMAGPGASAAEHERFFSLHMHMNGRRRCCMKQEG